MTDTDSQPDPFIIGVTGNIACGKSTVMRELSALGADTIDADAVYHELIEPGKPLWGKILDRFGKRIAQPNGAIDRRALGQIVFSDPAALADLERITHPAIRADVLQRAFDSESAVVAVAAVKLIEGGWQEICDSIWIVVCPPSEQRRRLIESRGLSPDDADSRLAAQPPVEPKLPIADVIIDNGGSLAETTHQIRLAWDRNIVPGMPSGTVRAKQA